MFRIKALDHVVIRAKDLNGMVEFYEDVIGCAIDKRRDDLGLVHMSAGSSLIDLISVEGKLGQMGGAAPGSEGRNVDHICLSIEPFDIAELRSHFESKGISIGDVQENYGAEGYGPSIYVKDPEGNIVEFKGPAHK
jgi:catechol 2,3-dioxygenase-like lactoylglutathione lyase family enzyme